MIDAGAELCLAFIRQNSPGATHCVTLAESAGIHTCVCRADGPEVTAVRMRCRS